MILCSTAAADDLFGWNSSALTFNIFDLIWLVLDFESQCNSMGCSSWIGLSITFFLVRVLIDLIVLPLRMKIFLIIPIFYFPWFFSSPFIMTTSLKLIFTGFSLWLRLCLSLRAAKYSWTHLFWTVSLHLCTYLCYFLQLSLTYSFSGELSGNLISVPRIIDWCQKWVF